MNKIIALAALVTLAAAIPLKSNNAELELAQNKNAQYEFNSDIEDHINDQTQQRSETRDGLNVKGFFSYSDGYVKRTVHYVADEDGYRVTGEEQMPLDGPKVDVNGVASVLNKAHGTELKYAVKSIPEKDGLKF